MADKRTTPETPAGAQPDAPQDAGSGPRRKKRAAPTIDLTATELPQPEATSPPQSNPPPAPAQEPPAEARSGGPISLATLVAGVTGAATVMLVLVALWLTGLLPVRTVVSTDTGAQAPTDTKAIDTLTQRVNKIEGTISKLPASDAGVAERLAAADSAMKSLGIALNRRSDDTAATASQARERADAAVKAVTDLRASVQDAAKNSDRKSVV